MTFLVGSASTTGFTSTKEITSGAGANQLWLVGNPTDTQVAASGVARRLHLFVSDWLLQTNLKANLYDESNAGALLESVILTSSLGTGVITVPLPGSNSLVLNDNIRLGLYTEDGDPVEMWAKTGALTLRKFTSGTYTSPADPSNQTGGFESTNELYFAIDDIVADTVTPGASNYTFGDTITYTTSLTSLTSATLTDGEGNVFALTGVTDTSADIPDIVGGLVACLTGGVVLTVSDGTDSAPAAITLDPLTGYSLTTLTSLAGTPSWIVSFPTAAEVGDQGQKNEPRLTLNANGSYSTTGDTAFSEVVWVTAKNGGEITEVTYNFLEEGAGEGVSIVILKAVTLEVVTLEAVSLIAQQLIAI